MIPIPDAASSRQVKNKNMMLREEESAGENEGLYLVNTILITFPQSKEKRNPKGLKNNICNYML